MAAVADEKTWRKPRCLSVPREVEAEIQRIANAKYGGNFSLATREAYRLAFGVGDDPFAPSAG